MLNNKLNGILILIITLFVSYFSFSEKSENQEPHQLIIGEWQQENDEKSLWVFSNENVLKRIYDSEIRSIGTWHIVDMCEGEYIHEEDFGMLETTFESGITQCYVIQGLNGTLTLLSVPQGRLLIFDKVE